MTAHTQTAHTPTPWHVATNPGGPGDQPAFPSVRDSSGLKDGEDIICMPLGDSDTVKANAAFIVRAVNAHDDLLAACQALLKVADSCSRFAEEMPSHEWARYLEATEQARAAIERANT